MTIEDPHVAISPASRFTANQASHGDFESQQDHTDSMKQSGSSGDVLHAWFGEGGPRRQCLAGKSVPASQPSHSSLKCFSYERCCAWNPVCSVAHGVVHGAAHAVAYGSVNVFLSIHHSLTPPAGMVLDGKTPTRKALAVKSNPNAAHGGGSCRPHSCFFKQKLKRSQCCNTAIPTKSAESRANNEISTQKWLQEQILPSEMKRDGQISLEQISSVQEKTLVNCCLENLSNSLLFFKGICNSKPPIFSLQKTRVPYVPN